MTRLEAAGIVNAVCTGRCGADSVMGRDDMGRNRTNGLDNLANAAKAAGFAMATPDDRPEDTPSSNRRPAAVSKSGWTSAEPSRALVLNGASVRSAQTSWREWMASFSWRAPA